MSPEPARAVVLNPAGEGMARMGEARRAAMVMALNSILMVDGGLAGTLKS